MLNHRPKLDRRQITKDYTEWAKQDKYHSGIVKLMLVSGMILGLSVARIGGMIIPALTGTASFTISQIIFWFAVAITSGLIALYAPIVQAVWMASHNRKESVDQYVERLENGSQTDDEAKN